MTSIKKRVKNPRWITGGLGRVNKPKNKNITERTGGPLRVPEALESKYPRRKRKE